MELFNMDEFGKFLNVSNTFGELEGYIASTSEHIPIIVSEVHAPLYDYCTEFTIQDKKFNFKAYIDSTDWNISFHNTEEYRSISGLNKEGFFLYCYAFLVSLKNLLSGNDIRSIQFIYFNKMERISKLMDSVIFKFIMNLCNYKYSKRIIRGSINQITYIKGE